MSDRTFKLKKSHMTGEDVKLGQRDLRKRLEHWGASDYPLEVDGDYGVATRAAYQDVAYGLGIAQDELKEGITPRIRRKIRHAELTDAEMARYKDREGWRKQLAEKHKGGGFSSPLVKIITHANGFSSWHDGVDLICPVDAHGFAMMKAKVVRVSDSWWGLGAPADQGLKDKGDGIVIIQSLVDAGPIKKGDYFGYGHAEKSRVRTGDTVSAGQWICNAGYANAWHFHMMQFRGDPGKASDGGPRGVGNRDPWPAVDYCINHS